MKKKFLTISFAIILSLGLTGCDEAEVYSLSDKEKSSKEIYELKEKVYCDGVEFSVTNIQEKTNKQDAGIRKGEKLVAVTYKVKNTKKTEKGFYSSDFSIINSNGEIINSTFAVLTSMWEGDFFKGATLVSGGEKEGYFVYLLKENDEDYTIQYKCSGSLFSKDVVVKVKNK